MLHILVLFSIYSILAVSLDLLVGHTGLLSMAHAAFYGLGSYASALMAVRLGASFPVGVLVGGLVAVLISFIVSLPSLRLHDDYFVIATFGFQMIILSIFNNWTSFTRGPLGIAGIPRPVLLGHMVQSNVAFVALGFLLAVFSYLIVWRIISSAFGRVLWAIREDEIFARSLGKDTLRFKISVFAVSAMLAALAGALYAHYITYIDPTSFTVMESILVISMVIIGGAGSLWGPLIGAVFLVTLPEALRFIGLPVSVAAECRQIIYGTLLVIVMLVRPNGIAGRYDLGRQ